MNNLSLLIFLLCGVTRFPHCQAARGDTNLKSQQQEAKAGRTASLRLAWSKENPPNQTLDQAELLSEAHTNRKTLRAVGVLDEIKISPSPPTPAHIASCMLSPIVTGHGPSFLAKVLQLLFPSGLCEFNRCTVMTDFERPQGQQGRQTFTI